MIGKTISHYKILEKLGEGGMGVVYKAQDTTLDRFVAIKFLPPHLSKDEEATKRFIHEAKAASALDHANIGTIHEVEKTSDGRTFIVMAYYEGETLRERIDRGNIPLEEALNITSQVASGLARAHETEIVHRDIKPSNIIITKHGEAKIIDFGLAKLAGKTRLTKEGSTLGTAAYMSPEQAKGEEVDHRSDIFSLGGVFYELLAGEPPFTGEHEAALLYEIVHEEPKPLSDYKVNLSEDLQHIVNRALKKNAGDRYQSAFDIIADLENAKTEFAQSVPSISKARSIMGRNLTIIAISVLLIIIGYLIISRFITTKPGDAEAKRVMIAVLPFENLGATADEYFADGITEEITARLTGVRGLGVIARTSAVQYKNTEKTIRQIGEELGVEYILEGTIRWQRLSEGQSQVRITPQLIRVSDATHLWAEPYQEDLSDIFQVQISIATRVVDALNVTFLSHERQSLGSVPTENFEAYTYYLQGLRIHKYYDKKTMRETQRLYEKAIELDPMFALAYARLTFVHSLMYHYHFDRSQARIAMAEEAASMAEKLGPDLPDVHFVLGDYYYRCHKNYDKALEHLQIARNGRANDALIMEWTGYIQRRQGKWKEALENFKNAVELNPRKADLIAEYALTLSLLGRYSEANKYHSRAISLDPEDPNTVEFFVFYHLLPTGNTQKARQVLQQSQDHIDENNEEILRCLIELEIIDENYDNALTRLSSVRSESVYDSHGNIIPTATYIATVYKLMGQTQIAQVYYDSARVLLEGKVKVSPEDPRLHSALGITYAGLGRKEDAIEKGRLAVKMLPISREAFAGYDLARDLARIYTMVGEFDAAIDQLEYLLSIPGELSITLLQRDPRWSPLRDHPRFQKLIEDKN